MIRTIFSRMATLSVAVLTSILVFASLAAAYPITYTAFTVADGSLGNWQFHRAQIYLVSESDSRYAQTIDNYFNSGVTVSINSFGTFSVTIVAPGRTVTAHFVPGQLFVSIDRGKTADQPYVGGRGIGFGSWNADGSPDPTYPLALEDGTIDWGDGGFPSDELSGLSLDLTAPTAFSGRAWICTDFLNGDCPAPSALHTIDHGDFYLNQPYSITCACAIDGSQNDPLIGGFFRADYGRPPFPPPDAAGSEEGGRTSSIVYTGTLVTDVQLGNRFFSHAQVFIYQHSDTRFIQSLADTPGSFNPGGTFAFTILSQGQKITGRFAPGQLYAFFDNGNNGNGRPSVGFGSFASGRGYPLAITDNQDLDGLVELSAMTALYDFFYTPGGASLYSPSTASLVNWSGSSPGQGTASYTLATPTLLSGGASSCVSYDVTTSNCSSFTPAPLMTTSGDALLVFEPYTLDSYSPNWGIFLVEVPIRRD